MPEVPIPEETVILYRFSKYDINTDSVVHSKRWATQRAIDAIHGTIISEGFEVPISQVPWDATLQEMTVMDFNPNPKTGFQTEVRMDISQ